MIVVFCGLDGAGKTTQIYSLERYLLLNGIPVRKVWARGGYTPCFEFMKRWIRRMLGRRLPSVGDLEARQKVMRKLLVSRLWLMVAIFDLFLVWGVFLRLQKILGRVVICDRYIDDTRLDFRRNFPTVAFEKMWLWRFLERYAPSPDLAFVIWVPVEVSLRRSKEKCEPFPDTEDTLTWRLECYLDEMLFPADRYIRLDGRRPLFEVTSEVIYHIGGRLSQRA